MQFIQGKNEKEHRRQLCLAEVNEDLEQGQVTALCGHPVTQERSRHRGEGEQTKGAVQGRWAPPAQWKSLSGKIWATVWGNE